MLKICPHTGLRLLWEFQAPAPVRVAIRARGFLLNQLGRALNRLGLAPVRVAKRARTFLLNQLGRALNRLGRASVRVAIRARRSFS